jgi:hypothetical protein
MGKFPVQDAVLLARFAPYIATHSPGWIAVYALPAGTVPPGKIDGSEELPPGVTITFTGLDGIPLATTSRIEGPDSIDSGTSKLVDTGVAPVATPIVL